MMDISEKTIHTIRTLAADMVQKANSGHPGAPMGLAPAGYALYAHAMNHSPAHPEWLNRDRFVLSNGHAGALIYALLHLLGYRLSMDELQSFRQAGSLTPGHPEQGHTPGVDTSTGPLGQGVANAVGFAIAETMLAAKFNRPGFPVIDHYTYAICGDGCMMEGVCAEAVSLAGTLALGKMILLYDDNGISIEGSTDIAMKEDIGLRFQAYGWHVVTLKDGQDDTAILQAINEAKQDARPSLIITPTLIGYGCEQKEGKASAHGEPLGKENVAAMKRRLGMPPDDFYVSDDVYQHLAQAAQAGNQKEAAWQDLLCRYFKTYPDMKDEWNAWFACELPKDLADDEALYDFPKAMATRICSYEMIQRLAARIPNLVGGSADLAPSNKTTINGGGDYSAENRLGRNIHFGVREHAMAAMANGMALHGGLRVFCSTFFVFSDYMKNAMRMSAMMKLPVIYILTHDSIGVGEDGPTHQPVEHLAGLRAMPGLDVFRPADGHETAAAWLSALNRRRPTCLILTRQDLPSYTGSGKAAFRGAYILKDSDGAPDILLMASGSEVAPLMEARELFKISGVDARVISVPCMELFNEQDEAYKHQVMPPHMRARLAMEAGSAMPWYQYTGLDGSVIAMEEFGQSAPAGFLLEKYGFTAGHAVKAGEQVIKKNRG
ncbi:MAG: transketolase [Clostridia bacterium]|nr:transketolase [Clostridia bacterium]